MAAARAYDPSDTWFNLQARGIRALWHREPQGMVESCRAALNPSSRGCGEAVPRQRGKEHLAGLEL